jgi:hypothetical protein
MPLEKPENALRQGFPSSAWPQFEWSKKAIEMSATACSGVLGFTAQRLQAQADFLQSLASCGDLPELLRRQSEFRSSAWAAYAGGLSHALNPGKGGSPRERG